jgi:hypothetical protein
MLVIKYCDWSISCPNVTVTMAISFIGSPMEYIKSPNIVQFTTGHHPTTELLRLYQSTLYHPLN